MTARFAKPLIVLGLLAVGGVAFGRSSDRNQPMDIDAGRQQGTVEGNGDTLFSGGVTVTQGTLNIKAATARITQSSGDISRVVLNGAPATLTQQLDDGTPFTARANQIDYDMRTDVVVLTGNFTVSTPRGSSTGQRLVYNLKSGQIDSGGDGGGRVRMRIMPRAAQGTP